jgi:hypothetical protein
LVAIPVHLLVPDLYIIGFPGLLRESGFNLPEVYPPALSLCVVSHVILLPAWLSARLVRSGRERAAAWWYAKSFASNAENACRSVRLMLFFKTIGEMFLFVFIAVDVSIIVPRTV